MVDHYHLQPGTASTLIFCLDSHLCEAFLYHTINKHPNPWQHSKAFQWMRDPKLLTKKGALMDSMKPTYEDLQNTGKQVCRRKLICQHPYLCACGTGSAGASLFCMCACLRPTPRAGLPSKHVDKLGQGQENLQILVLLHLHNSASQASPHAGPNGKHRVPAAVAALGAAACKRFLCT